MNFALSDEQSMLKEAATRFVREQYGFEHRRSLLGTPAGWSREHWHAYADFGWLGLLVPEEFGGMGCSMVEANIVLEALGESIALEPVLASAVLSATLIDRSGNDAIRASRLPLLASGEAIFAVACEEAHERKAAAQELRTTAEPTAEGWRLRGSKILVLGGGQATEFIVSARISGDGPGQLGLFMVNAASAGLTVQPYRLVDGRSAADLLLDGVQVGKTQLLASGDVAVQALDHALDIARLGAMAEALGGMEACLSITSEYIKTRVQFKQPIGKFQSLQHLMADMFVDTQESRSIVLRALAHMNEPPAARRHAVAAARVVAGESGRRVSSSGVQMHGGYGQVEEYRISHHFRQMFVLNKLFGDVQDSLAVLASSTKD